MCAQLDVDAIACWRVQIWCKCRQNRRCDILYQNSLWYVKIDL